MKELHPLMGWLIFCLYFSLSTVSEAKKDCRTILLDLDQAGFIVQALDQKGLLESARRLNSIPRGDLRSVLAQIPTYSGQENISEHIQNLSGGVIYRKLLKAYGSWANIQRVAKGQEVLNVRKRNELSAKLAVLIARRLAKNNLLNARKLKNIPSGELRPFLKDEENKSAFDFIPESFQKLSGYTLYKKLLIFFGSWQKVRAAAGALKEEGIVVDQGLALMIAQKLYAQGKLSITWLNKQKSGDLIDILNAPEIPLSIRKLGGWSIYRKLIKNFERWPEVERAVGVPGAELQGRDRLAG